MSNLRIAIRNHLDDDDNVGYTSQAINFPGTNTRKKSRGTVWRSVGNDTNGGDGLAPHTFTYTFDTTRAANVFAFNNHNLAGGTVRLRLYNAIGSPSSTVYDSGAVTIPVASSAMAGANYGLGGSASAAGAADDIFGATEPFVFYFPATAFQGADITFTTGPASTAAGYLQVGRLWLGMYKEPVRSADFGAQLSWQTNTQSGRTRGGSLRSNNGEVWRRLELDLSGVAPSERAFWADVQRYAQTSRDVIVDVFPGDAGRDGRDHRFIGQVVTLNALVYEFNYRKTHLAIEEL